MIATKDHNLDCCHVKYDLERTFYACPPPFALFSAIIPILHSTEIREEATKVPYFVGATSSPDRNVVTSIEWTSALLP